MAMPRAGLAWWISWGKVSYRPPSLYRVGAFQLIFKDQLGQRLFVPPFLQIQQLERLTTFPRPQSLSGRTGVRSMLCPSPDPQHVPFNHPQKRFFFLDGEV